MTARFIEGNDQSTECGMASVSSSNSVQSSSIEAMQTELNHICVEYPPVKITFRLQKREGQVDATKAVGVAGLIIKLVGALDNRKVETDGI